MTTSLLRRVSTQPVISYGAVPGYGPIFNPGLLRHDHRLYLLARAVRTGYRTNPGAGDRFLDYVSDILVFTSNDGRHYDFDSVLLPSQPGECYEDPRAQVISDTDGEHL